LACILLLLGIQLAFTGPRPPWAGQGKPIVRAAPQRESPLNVPLPASPVLDDAERENPDDYRLDMVSLASTHIPWPVRATVAGDTIAVDTSAVDTSAVAIPSVEAAPALPRAPRLRPKALSAALAASAPRAPVKARPLQLLMARYDAASNVAYARLESGMRAARLNRLFAPGRLTAGGGVPATRLSLAGAANFIRVYRQQQAAIDQAYQDSVGMLAKRNGWKPKEIKQWSSRPPRKETPTLQLLTSSLLASIDSILGVLDEQAGAYKIRGSAIAFENPAATQAYAALRRRIKEGIDGAVGAGGATSFGPAGLLLQAIGTSTLPRET
jgi:hypothetical protein